HIPDVLPYRAGQKHQCGHSKPPESLIVEILEANGHSITHFSDTRGLAAPEYEVQCYTLGAAFMRIHKPSSRGCLVDLLSDPSCHLRPDPRRLCLSVGTIPAASARGSGRSRAGNLY